MASYLIILNVFFVAVVLAGITGSLLWAITTQQRDWPAAPQAAATKPAAVPAPAEAAPVPVLGAELAAA